MTISQEESSAQRESIPPSGFPHAADLSYQRAFEIPGAPRAMACSELHKLVCVGARDGSVMFCPHDGRPHRSYFVAPDRPQRSDIASETDTTSSLWTGGVRALSEVPLAEASGGFSWWLVGHLDGTLEWLRLDLEELNAHWDGTEAKAEVRKVEVCRSYRVPQSNKELRDLVHIQMLSEELLIVSYAASVELLDARDKTYSSEIYSVTKGESDDSAPVLQRVARLAVKRCARALSTRSDEWLLLTYTAELWHLQRVSTDDSQHEWRADPVPVDWVSNRNRGPRPTPDQGWQPSIVLDAAIVQGAGGQGLGIMASTDTGVFLYVPAPPEALVDVLQLYCTGVGGLALGLTCFPHPSNDYVYAWFSDSLGSAHLYRTRASQLAAPHWNRLQVRRDQTPAIRAHSLSCGSHVFVWQTCQDQHIRLVDYDMYSSRDVKAINDLSIDEIEPWLVSAYGDKTLKRGEEDSTELLLSANFADLLDPPKSRADYLWEFLSDPKPTLALSVLVKISDAAQPHEVVSLIERSLRLWSQTLVGSILRLAPAKLVEDYALGSIRWLNLLRREAPKSFETRPALAETIKNTANGQIFNVRRWTFYAPAVGDHLPHAARQVARLREEEKGVPLPDLSSFYEERIAAETALFVHRVDDEGRLPEAPERGVPFDISVMAGTDPKAPTLAAALWRTSEIGLFLVSKQNPGRKYPAHQQLEPWGQAFTLGHAFEYLSRLPGDLFDAGRSLGSTQRFGRALALFRPTLPRAKNDGFFVLCSVRMRSERQKQDLEYLLLLWSDGRSALQPRGHLRLDAPSLTGRASSDDKTSDYSLFSCCQLGADRVVLGLRGPLGAHLVIVSAQNGRLGLVANTWVALKSAYGEAYSEPESRLSNPVSALAHFVETDPIPQLFPEKYDVVAGCGDGQIWRVQWEVGRRGECTKQSEDLVGRLSTPIWSLAMSQPADSGGMRVFAGGEDGQIVAWQQLPAAPATQPLSRTAGVNPAARAGLLEQSASQASAFVVLWATRERGAIVRLCYVDVTEGAAQPQPWLLAISRDGRAVVFSDEARVAYGAARSLENAGRPHVPGQRSERFKLRSPAFAAALIPDNTGAAEAPVEWQMDPIARLLVINAKAGMRLLGLHQPKRGSRLRRENYKGLWDLCMRALGTSKSGGIDAVESMQATPGGVAGTKMDFMRLRHAESLRALAPLLYLLPVPFFLPDPDASWQHNDLERQKESVRELNSAQELQKLSLRWAPRYFRPYARAVSIFQRIASAVATNDSEISQRDLSSLTDELRRALENAFELGDQRLFDEVMEHMLKRFNAVLARASLPNTAPSQIESVADAYEKLMELFETACRWWLGVDPVVYAKVEIVRVKNFVDGRVLRLLTDASARKDGSVGAFIRIIRCRVQHVERLLMVGDPMVQQETLRAVNMSLLRAAWLQREAENTGKPSSWPEIEPFVNTLGAFAMIAARNADDTLAHELVRSFALCPFVSPQNAETAAFAIHLARMPQELIDDIRQQVKLIPQLLQASALPSSDLKTTRALEAFGHVLDMNLGNLDQGGKWHHGYAPCAAALKWLEDTSRQLNRAPSKVDFSLLPKLVTGLEETEERDGKGHFSDDYAFWSTQLKALLTITYDSPLLRPLPRHEESGGTSGSVRPVLVLESSNLAKWACDARLDLDNRFSKLTMHEPQYSNYKRALERFEELMAGLNDSVAVQRQLVTGVLDHDLLERLDEHVFELWDLAHALDPVGAEASFCDASRPRTEGSVARFAATLTQQMKRAAAIPKNLRTLYQLLDGRVGAGKSQTAEALVLMALPNADRESRVDCVWYTARTSDFIKLVLEEIAQNHRIHGSRTRRPQVSVERASGSAASEVCIRIRVPLSDDASVRPEQELRLRSLMDHGIQGFMPKAQHISESNGLGLYLANLAAAIVRHRILVTYPSKDRDHAEFCVVGLEERIEGDEV